MAENIRQSRRLSVTTYAVDALAAPTWDELFSRSRRAPEPPAADEFVETLWPLNWGQGQGGTEPGAQFEGRKAYLPQGEKILKKLGSLSLCRVTDDGCGTYTLTV